MRTDDRNIDFDTMMRRERRNRIVAMSGLLALSFAIIAGAYAIDGMFVTNRRASEPAATRQAAPPAEVAQTETLACTGEPKAFTAGESIAISGNRAFFSDCVVGDGWSKVEAAFVWQDQRESRITFDVDAEVSLLFIDVDAFTPADHKQTTRVFANGKFLSEVEFDGSSPRREIEVEIEPGSTHIEIAFQTDTLKSPSEAGINSDTRKLGIRLFGASFE